MQQKNLGIKLRRAILLLAGSSLLVTIHLAAQNQNRAQIAGQKTPRAAAPRDFTGYWVSLVTEDWRVRMMVPDKGDYVTVPLNAAGTKVADAWDPAKDEAAGEQCKPYGAAAIMHVPGRLHIYWQDDKTLRIDTDSGTQTRLLHFGGTAPENMTAEWQGYSVASWEGTEPIYRAGGGGRPISQGTPMGGEASEGQRKPGPPGLGYLKVITTRMRPGYLRKNGVPYSGNTTMEEYFDSFSEPNGDTWLVVTTIVSDPQYLVEPLIYNSHFKKTPDASGWDPTPCRVDEAR